VTKICIVGPSKKYFSGISAYTICLANAFAGNNRVSALMLRNLLPRFLYPGIKNVGREDFSLEFTPDIPVYEGMDWNSPLSWIRAYRFLKKEKPDVIIMAWWTSAVAHMELCLALFNSVSIKAKLVLEMHEIVDPLEAGELALRLYSRLMGKLIMNRTAAFVVHSDIVKNQAVEAYGLKKEMVFVIPIGVNISNSAQNTKQTARKELGIKEEFVILNFGMIRKYKGVPCLVRAFDKLPPEIALNSRLMIAGEDWGDEKELEPLIKASPYIKQITYQPEFVPDTAVPTYFSAADVVVLPYLRTSGSAVANMAIAFGKPIIISDLEHTRESMGDYQGAMLVPQGDDSSISGKIGEVYAQHKAGKVLSYPIPKSCGWDNVTDRFQKVISQISKTEYNKE
jgi:glycosyltransferase involved in cell wall biosynthesis